MGDSDKKIQELNEGSSQLCCFYIGDTICGVNINHIQEINKDPIITSVPLSEDYILGIMNLRGQIVTVLDLGQKLGLKKSEDQQKSRVIIANWKDEKIGLKVDRIADVVTCYHKDITAPPSNINGLQVKYMDGVYQDASGLIAILVVDKILDEETK